jgi:glycosyltransferase involved in cell wall biosynthesis
MNIAVDASQLSELNRVGTQVYLYNLLHSLSVIDKTNRYIVYLRNPISEEFFNEMVTSNPNFTFKVLKKRVSWTQVSLALELLNNPSDALIAPWQTMPIVHRKSMKILGIIHGVGEYKKWAFGPTLYTCIFADKVVAVSQFTKDRIVNNFKVSPNKVSVVYEGVDTSVFYPRSGRDIVDIRQKYGIVGNYIFFIGTLVPRKNLDRMFAAFARIVQEENNSEDTKSSKYISFIVAGSVPNEYKSVHELPEKYGISENVKFLGRVSQEDACRLMSGSMFLSYVSLTEGFGLPVIEAMSCGTPVLSSNTGALPEVAGEAAVLVDPFDVGEIYDGMSTLAQTGNREEYIRKGYVNSKRFEWGNTARNILNELIKI